MGKFYNTPACVSDAAGYNVNFDTEYMYTSTGKEIPISYFKYDREQGWFACSEAGLDDCAKCDKSNILCSDYSAKCITDYKVSELYIQHPAVVNIGNLIRDIHKLKDRIKYDTEVKEGMYNYLHYDLRSEEPYLNKLNTATYIYMILDNFITRLEKLGEVIEEN